MENRIEKLEQNVKYLFDSLKTVVKYLNEKEIAFAKSYQNLIEELEKVDSEE
jgi:hypothetical protein